MGLHVDAEPAAKSLVNLPALDGPDVVAVRTKRLLAAERAVAIGNGQPFVGFVPAPNLFVALPDRIALAVPTEFVGMNQIPWRDAADDGPGQKAIGGRVIKVARRFPASAAGVVK